MLGMSPADEDTRGQRVQNKQVSGGGCLPVHLHSEDWISEDQISSLQAQTAVQEMF